MESESHMMVNLATVLAMLFSAEISLLSAIIGLSAITGDGKLSGGDVNITRDDVNITGDGMLSGDSNISGWAAVTTVFSIASTMVGLCSAIFFQIPAQQVKKGHATMWLMHPSAAKLQRLPILAVPVSCVSITFGLAFSVCGHYGKHWSALVAAVILFAALLGCVRARFIFDEIQKDCKEDMHLIANYEEMQTENRPGDGPGDGPDGGLGEDVPLVSQGDGAAQNARH